jgi:hypothetical protein
VSRGRVGLLMSAAAVALWPPEALAQDRFDHQEHARVFPTCVVCHQGAADSEAPMWPAPVACAACHDGSIERRVTWRPPDAPHPSNLKFVHDLVPLMTRETPQGPQSLECRDCHLAPGGGRMAVERTRPETCLACHVPGTPHLAVADTACVTCHLPLARAATIRNADVARFPAPPSHQTPGFATGAGHGARVRALTDPGSSSCAVCHARDFCLTCHVDAPEQRAIQALDPDPRARAIVVALEPPSNHRDAVFLSRHGALVRENPAQCASCHTQESCFTCHAPAQRVATALHRASPGRGSGALPGRRPPASHGDNFAERHENLAVTTPATCGGCHVRSDCLDCHRPDAAGRGYHPAGFLTTHPAAAYTRESRCGDCHNVGSFCASCHASAGLRSTGPLGSGYHDASRFFSASHGQAARQSLESCTACHAERDCLTCHSAQGGRRFNPHGPGFDADRLRRKNSEMCSACHGALIPGGSP